MKSNDLGIVGGEDDFEIEVEGRKQPNGGYMYFYLRYLKGRIAILEVALFDFLSGCDSLAAYEKTGVVRIRAWGKEEVVRVMEKLKLDRPRKQERVTDKEAEEKEEETVVGVNDVEETLERHKGEVEGKIDGVAKEVDVLRGELKMVTGGKIDRVVKEVVELRSELTGVKGVVEKNLDEGEKNKGNDVDVIYTPESVIEVNLDSECLAPQKNKQKVEKTDIPSGIDELEAEMCDYLWNSGLESEYSLISMGNRYASVSDVATLKPKEWVGSVVIDLLVWTVCYDSKKSLWRIGYLPYHLAQHALETNIKVNVDGIVSFWGPILDNYVKFTDCEKIMITINYHNSHWYLLVLDMVERVAMVYDSLFTSEAAKQRVNDAKRLIYCGIYVMMRMESIGSRGATGDFVVVHWDRIRILNDLDVRLDQEREEIDPISHEDDQPMGDAMMEEAPQALSGDDVTIKIVMHNIDRVLEKLPLFSDQFLFVWDQGKFKIEDNVTYCKDLNDFWNEYPDFNALNTLFVDDSARKMIYNPINNYICPHPFDVASRSDDDAQEKGGNIREYLENLLKAPNVPDFVRNNHFPLD
ncbi:hypothetical protein F3Y22_tig00111783pilonHSYRG00200 [Hibiscus syriacus]|uniref:Ubiquitin-like protease family profile domain-containing protein n=1 Tax=Hibiscus syriacus TaxID=106335 RepID=A0A6A2Y8S3_HIBSY|nr:hypothetical protein F3Y22_tig00111783pilonHSYRG00200 [Hibiscus syriacus]